MVYINDNHDKSKINTIFYLILEGEPYEYDQISEKYLLAPCDFVAIFSLPDRRIEPGEELFVDYNDKYWETSRCNKFGQKYLHGPAKQRKH